MTQQINIGLDAGSTTVKIVVTDNSNNVIFKDYQRHFANISGTVIDIFEHLHEIFGNVQARLTITGSAGMGLAERSGIPFTQEVISSCEVIKTKFPHTKTLVDIGGEDAKMIFFRDNGAPDMRMNGSCAGGTGAFIDQMASLLAVEVSELSLLAEKAKTIYPIASRCGVFSKTDVQNLLSRNVSREDVAASVFHAVSMQVITSLARGYEVEGKLFLCGGPFTFIPAMRKSFEKLVKLSENDIILSEYSEVVSAWGAAIKSNRQSGSKSIREIIDQIKDSNVRKFSCRQSKLQPLFSSVNEFNEWLEGKKRCQLPKADISAIKGNGCYIGIDSGSTTTKIIATDAEGRIFFHFYSKNKGSSLMTVAEGLEELAGYAESNNKELKVLGSCVTGYGEDLIKTAYSLNYGVVETIAHYTAAHRFEPKVSFIIDIGGQDMKAAFIENGAIKRLEINEACSSGCGSFIETFAHSLNHTPQKFSEIAVSAEQPYDLGTRCTVFMNSKVKQALREGATIPDIAAGLGYSVIKNCLNKVLKLKDISVLGSHIMAQGGTFRNKAVLRSLENETGKTVMITDLPELMGAYGAVLFAIEESRKSSAWPVDIKKFVRIKKHSHKISVCNGCENQCTVTSFRFDDGNRYYTGNKCEKIFTNTGEKKVNGENIYPEKHNLLFNRKSIKNGKLRIGMPRALGLYENYPFWHELFSSCEVEVVLSDPSTMQLYEKGIGSVMADNICFPAKLAHGHILNLAGKKVGRIFMPFVVHDKKEDEKAINSYNCPIVTGYSEVIRSAMDPAKNFNIPLDAPTFTFRNEKMLKKACKEYLQKILPGIPANKFNRAFLKAVNAQRHYEEQLAGRCKEIFKNAIDNGRIVVLLTGRPYHSDPLIQHKISEIISGFGADVISEDIVRESGLETMSVQSIMQWAYTNRILKSALWAAEAPPNLHYIELTSFGCGPDAFIIDEVTDILHRKGRNATILKVDDINNVGSTRLRIRSLIESLKFKYDNTCKELKVPVHTPPFLKSDRRRKILLPWFADFYSPFLPTAFALLGYNAENLPPSNQASAEFGLKYSNNEICYPATLIIGDFMKALKSGKYNPDEIALGISQTGGQCRATNYIALMKKALLSAGFNNIPVISVSSSSKKGGLNEQPGFSVDWLKIIKVITTCLAYADCISQMYYATAPRETEKGVAQKLKNKYIHLGIDALRRKDSRAFYHLVSKAAQEFEAANNKKQIPRIGIVGEIFVKYNNFGHKNIVNWLIEQEIEPVIPPLSDFFSGEFASFIARVEGNIRPVSISDLIMKVAYKYLFRIINKMESRISSFPYFRPTDSPHYHARKASKIININAQFGEGWRIPADFAHFAETGINNVVSLQPFGCIANQVISKGIEKRTRELYPSLNLLFLDFDSGMAEANIFNRLHFMLQNARNEAEADHQPLHEFVISTGAIAKGDHEVTAKLNLVALWQVLKKQPGSR